MGLVDIGANLTDRNFAKDRRQVVERALAAGVEQMVVTGVSVAKSRAALALADASRLFATAGIHPHDASSVEPGWEDAIRELAKNRRVVAIGETGLDFNRNYSPPDVQRTVFRQQIALAVELDLPLFVHDRDSGGQTRALLSERGRELGRCVVHCFTGTAADLAGYLDDGWHIGITGWVCDERRGVELQGLVADIPRERLMLETDAPWLLPRTMSPRPKGRRNEPAFLPWVARKVAECRGESFEEVAAYTSDNARRFFDLPLPRGT
ncbi:MAG: hydrolase TatD [Gammaproteobacteria bacterium]|nr:hydrolase TatD [Gammaproteobacteria bacterium]